MHVQLFGEHLQQAIR